MQPLVKIFLYLFFSVLIGAIVAPIAYWGVALLPVHDGVLSHFIHSVQQMPFHRYESRSIQVVAFLFLLPTIFSLKVYSLSDLSLFPNRFAFTDSYIGILAAIIPLWLLEVFFLSRNWYVLDTDFSFLLLPKIILTAITVALFEEFIFRGVLLGLCRRVFNNEVAIVFTAIIFAGIHFLNFPHINLETVHCWSGLVLLLKAGHGFSSYSLAFGAFITLLIVGVILAWVTIRTESLFLAMGLHGAWIFGQQFFNLMASCHIEPPNSFLPWVGVSQIYGMVPVGIFTLFPFMMTFFLLKQWFNKRENISR